MYTSTCTHKNVKVVFISVAPAESTKISNYCIKCETLPKLLSSEEYKLHGIQ